MIGVNITATYVRLPQPSRQICKMYTLKADMIIAQLWGAQTLSNIQGDTM